MSTAFFSWDAFSDEIVSALVEAWDGGQNRHIWQTPRDWLNARMECPSDRFVKDTVGVLTGPWLAESPGAAKQFVDLLLAHAFGPGGSPRTHQDCMRYVQCCRRTVNFRRFLLTVLLHVGSQGPDVRLALTPPFAILRPGEQPEDPRRPYPHQLDAWERLSLHLAESAGTGVFQGLLVMPTGGGKTYTAVRWLVENVVNRGERVVWIAHRHELLD